MDETLDGLDEDQDELEEEADAEVDKVLYDLTDGKLGVLTGKAGSSLPVRIRDSGGVDRGESEETDVLSSLAWETRRRRKGQGVMVKRGDEGHLGVTGRSITIVTDQDETHLLSFLPTTFFLSLFFLKFLFTLPTIGSFVLHQSIP